MDGNLITWIIIVAALGGIYAFVNLKFTDKSGESEDIKKSSYRYYAKSYIMTQHEREFFKTLNEVLGSKWYVVPQVHLSTLLNHKVKGQNWKGAFQHINGKSVDFVLLSKETTKPICAIELDDSSHDRADRSARDDEVERIFKQANIPLARFRKTENLSKQDIVNTIALAIKTSE
ncbi:DUF2726 domain-containing protein [Candidatus Saccharibacteria bacterium]|nr:DUF2726 domain-containing protein [Candidatus Saccharibacteria bacterium]